MLGWGGCFVALCFVLCWFWWGLWFDLVGVVVVGLVVLIFCCLILWVFWVGWFVICLRIGWVCFVVLCAKWVVRYMFWFCLLSGLCGYRCLDFIGDGVCGGSLSFILGGLGLCLLVGLFGCSSLLCLGGVLFGWVWWVWVCVVGFCWVVWFGLCVCFGCFIWLFVFDLVCA